jgi:bifunctional non-homologous end joining protein LigD
MAGLQEYRAKRDFKKTVEPAGDAKSAGTKEQGGLFVMHKHAATRLHYDLRLEHGGVLWSWAVTRGPSLDPAERRLAVHVEDHPLDYGSFEGNIPKGQYGGGAVVLWDEGTWRPEGDPNKGMKKGHIKFQIDGQKLQGAWHLVRLKPRPGEKRENWLLIKSDDEHADPRRDILAEMPQSVKSGLTIEEVAEGLTAKDKPKPQAKKARTARPARTKKLPDFIPPCLARLESTPPSGNEWIHEVKFDGYRLQAHVVDGAVTLYTRTGLDWTHKFGNQIIGALARLDCETAVVDGEVVVLAANGVSEFSGLQLALTEGRTEAMIFYAFDLLHLDGKDLRGEPLLHRKERLRDLLGEDEGEGHLRYSEHFVESGQTMLAHACRMGLEGVISKRADAPYRSGRGHDWLKSKCTLRQEFLIAGYLPSDKTGRGIRSLIMSYRKDGKLVPGGNVGTGFTAETLRDLQKKLDPLRVKSAPFTGPAARQKGAVWVEPKLVAEIEFRSWTRDGSIRQGSFQGLREDKPAEEVVAETAPADTAAPASDEPGKKGGARRNAAKAPKTSVTLSNPTKKLWPEEGLTKQGLLDYYALVWPRMKLFVLDRPLSLVRAPDGLGGQRFFQKHSMPGMHESILKSHDPEDGEEVLYIRDFDGLAALVQLGVVEVHIWGAKVETIGEPDQIVFDLDPDEGLGVEDVRAATFEVREKLEELGFATFLKTSGGKGFHVVVPLKPKAGWNEVKGFANDFARALAQSAPERYTATLSKNARKGRIFVDYLRNGRGSTTIAPYSSRAKKGATMSMPITWKMLESGVGPADFRIGEESIAERLAADDPWADFFKKGKALKRR